MGILTLKLSSLRMMLLLLFALPPSRTSRTPKKPLLML
jgi:hypothetical protein